MFDPPTPQWIEKLPARRRKTALNKFRLKMAALYYSEPGSLSILSEALGYNRAALSATDNITPENAIKIEKLMGREVVTREFLRPDLFKIEE